METQSAERDKPELTSSLTCMYSGDGNVLTLTKLVIEARRNLLAISTITASCDRVSCLNKAPHVARVDDLKNCGVGENKTSHKLNDEKGIFLFESWKGFVSHQAGMSSES